MKRFIALDMGLQKLHERKIFFPETPLLLDHGSFDEIHIAKIMVPFIKLLVPYLGVTFPGDGVAAAAPHD